MARLDCIRAWQEYVHAFPFGAIVPQERFPRERHSPEWRYESPRTQQGSRAPIGDTRQAGRASACLGLVFTGCEKRQAEACPTHTTCMISRLPEMYRSV